MIEEGEENSAFAPVWNYLPTEANKKLIYEADISTSSLLPNGRSYYQYMGSFTTPPCTESVNWFVLANPVELSAAQIARFTAVVNNNNRPVQPLNGRDIKRSAKSVGPPTNTDE